MYVAGDAELNEIYELNFKSTTCTTMNNMTYEYNT